MSMSGRSAQAFPNPIQWGTAYSLDSSSSTWVNHTNGHIIGDIATDDNGVDPLITAIVRHDGPEIPSEIRLIILNGNKQIAYQDAFSWAEYHPQGYIYCRHPAVEVTYSHEGGGLAGQLAVHVIWAEQIGPALEEQWEIFYRYLEFIPSPQTPWQPVVDEMVNVTDCEWSHDTQPDLCVWQPDGDLFAVFKSEVDSVNVTGIFLARLPYDDDNDTWEPYMWELAGSTTNLDAVPKEFPSIDAGRFTTPGSGQQLAGHVGVVWSQPIDSQYGVYFNAFDPGSPADPADSVLISLNGLDSHAILPKIDVLPYSSGLNEAIITWAEHAVGPDMFPPDVMLVATPFIGPDYDDNDYVYNIGPDFGLSDRCPDLAGYQGEHVGFEGEGLFALAHHHSDTSIPGGYKVRATAIAVRLK